MMVEVKKRGIFIEFIKMEVGHEKRSDVSGV